MTTARSGEPAVVTWQGTAYTVDRVLRTSCTGGTGRGGLSTPLLEHWWLECGEATLHVYSVEYGAPGRPGGQEQWWWLAAIDPDPRGFMRLM